jgi:glycosyltransferase involved in cell wall biosynthesis
LRPDLVHTNSLKAAIYGGFAARIVGIPVVWHVRDRIADDYLPSSAARLVRALARRLPIAVIANSKATLESLGQAVSSISAVVPSPVIQAPSPAGGGTQKPSSAVLRVGIVGRLMPWKGQHLFLDAFNRAFPEGDALAVIVGSPMFGEEAYEVELKNQIDRLGLGERVELRGFRENIWAELDRVDVLVLASLIPEPFGNVVVEGMAAGLAVLAPAAGGPAEIITDGVDGLLYPMGDAVALAGRLHELATNPGLRRKLGDAGRRRAADFSPDIAAAAVIELYRRVLGDRCPGRMRGHAG